MRSSFNLRYDHYGTLCELLPAALPSLAYCLQALRHGKVPFRIIKARLFAVPS